MRRLVAFLFHAPGLRLFYGEHLPTALGRANGVAVLATVAAIVGAYLFLPTDTRIAGAFLVWLIGHFIWGTYLAMKLPARDDR